MDIFKAFFSNSVWKKRDQESPLFLWNALGERREKFEPIKKGVVGMYNCGPTVYHYAHIGNLRSYVFADIIRRTLEWNSYKVKQVINITDVGHLTDDGDNGADRLEEGARREHKPVADIIEMYSQAFFADLELLNIDIKKITFPRATNHIPEQIALIKKLEEKGYTYKTSDGVYFDTSKFSEYGKLAKIGSTGLDSSHNTVHRIEPNAEKRSTEDFALWKFSSSNKEGSEKRQQEWPSPWGIGFPGWHIECSAMSMKYLGESFDIHTGGIDHVRIHHNNEIAQSEAATGKPFVHFWLHNAFVNTQAGDKMAKSEGNFLRLKDLYDIGIDPLAYRYWLLTAHYRTPIAYKEEALFAAQTAYKKLVRSFALLSHKKGKMTDAVRKRFTEIINNDLDTPGAISFIWQLLHDKKEHSSDIRTTIQEIDKVLGLGIAAKADELVEKIRKAPSKVRELAHERELARKKSDWKTADALRQEVEKAGFTVEDTEDGPILMPKDL